MNECRHECWIFQHEVWRESQKVFKKCQMSTIGIRLFQSLMEPSHCRWCLPTALFFTNFSRALQNILSKFLYCRSRFSYENFKLQLILCVCRKLCFGHTPKVSAWNFTINVISGVAYFREIIWWAREMWNNPLAAPCAHQLERTCSPTLHHMCSPTPEYMFTDPEAYVLTNAGIYAHQPWTICAHQPRNTWGPSQ